MRQRPGEVYCVIVTPGEHLPSDSRVRERPLRPLVREFVAHDADGNEVETRRERVRDVVDGELRPAVITVLDVERNVAVVEVGREVASACGYKTAEGLRDAWFARHPRSPLCTVVSFALGDVRDRPLFLNWTGRAGGDYTLNRSRAIDDAEALTPEQLAALSSWNKQKDQARRATSARSLASETLAQRWERLVRATEQIGGEAARAIRPHRRVLEQRLKRSEGRK